MCCSSQSIDGVGVMIWLIIMYCVLKSNLFYFFFKSFKFTILSWCVVLFSVSVILQFNISELRDLYVFGTVG